MNDTEFFELQLRATIVPQQARWPAPEHVRIDGRKMQKGIRLRPAVQLAKFGVQPSFTEGSKQVRHLPRYLSIERDP